MIIFPSGDDADYHDDPSIHDDGGDNDCDDDDDDDGGDDDCDDDDDDDGDGDDDDDYQEDWCVFRDCGQSTPLPMCPFQLTLRRITLLLYENGFFPPFHSRLSLVQIFESMVSAGLFRVR